MYYFTLLVSLKTRPGQPVLCCCFAHPHSDCECSRLKTQIKTQGKQDSLCCHSRSSWAQHHMFLVARVKWQRRWTLYDYLSLSLSRAPPFFSLCLCDSVCVIPPPVLLSQVLARCACAAAVIRMCVCVHVCTVCAHAHVLHQGERVYNCTGVSVCAQIHSWIWAVEEILVDELGVKKNQWVGTKMAAWHAGQPYICVCVSFHPVFLFFPFSSLQSSSARLSEPCLSWCICAPWDFSLSDWEILQATITESLFIGGQFYVPKNLHVLVH